MKQKILLGLGIILIIILIILTPIYIKNYRELKKYYQSLPTQEINEQFAKIEFTKSNNTLTVSKVTIFSSDLIARAQKPESGWTIVVEEGNKDVFESYIAKSSQEPLTIVPYKTNADLVIKDIPNLNEIARYSFASLATKAKTESQPEKQYVKRNIQKEALYLTFLQIKAKFKNPISKTANAPKQQPETETNMAVANLPADPTIRAIAQTAPFSNDFMAVFYYPKVQSFTVIITENSFTRGKQKALTWFQDHQVKNLCALNLEFKKPDSHAIVTIEEKNTPGCPVLN